MKPERALRKVTNIASVSGFPRMSGCASEQTYKEISPYEASATPAEMQTTMTSVRCVGVSRPIRTDIPRTATEVNALSLRREIQFQCQFLLNYYL